MRVLAEFIMRGRAQAAVVALLGSWFPLISPAAVALVTLRRGSLDGTVVLLWAMLPPLASIWLSDIGPLMSVVSVVGLITALLAAMLLRSNRSWPQTLFALVALSCLFALMIGAFIPDPVRGVTQALGDMIEQIQSQSTDAQVAMQFTDALVLGLIAYVLGVSSLMSLLLARWWQAILYNPGGFQAEFHQLRLGVVGTAVCLLVVLYCWNQGLDYQYWASLFSLPLMVAGAALMHGLVKLKRLSGQWLVGFYLALVFASPVVIVLAVLDAWTDFRSRVSGEDSSGQNGDD